MLQYKDRADRVSAALYLMVVLEPAHAICMTIRSIRDPESLSLGDYTRSGVYASGQKSN